MNAHVNARVELKNVTNRFGKQVVHDHVDLILEENEILGLAGGSGSGKSVLLRTILGLNKPEGGEVRIDGEDIYNLPPERLQDIHRKCGVLFQNGALFSGLTVLDNVGLPLREHTDLSWRSIDNLASLKLGMVGLEQEAAAKYPSALSGGMTMRAALARAMALDPDILFLDEPTGALDPVAATALDDLMTSMQEILNLSILIVTHDLDTLVTVCDRIAMIADGRIETGTIEELLKSKNPKIQEYFDGPRMEAALSKRRRRRK